MFRSKSPGSAGLAAFLAAALALAGCSSSPSADTASGKEPEKSGGVLSKLFETTKPITVPEGTVIRVVLDQTISSAQSRSGDQFDASVSAPVVIDGKVVIPKGARARGRVIEARESGHLQTPARLALALNSVEVGGKSYDIETSSVGRAGPSHMKRNLGFIGGGAAGGALIGGIAGGGKGALIGSAVGAGAGTAGAALTGKKDIVIRAETPLSFRLERPVTIQVKS
jgi:hypothetical protein